MIRSYYRCYEPVFFNHCVCVVCSYSNCLVSVLTGLLTVTPMAIAWVKLKPGLSVTI